MYVSLYIHPSLEYVFIILSTYFTGTSSAHKLCLISCFLDLMCFNLMPNKSGTVIPKEFQVSKPKYHRDFPSWPANFVFDAMCL